MCHSMQKHTSFVLGEYAITTAAAAAAAAATTSVVSNATTALHVFRKRSTRCRTLQQQRLTSMYACTYIICTYEHLFIAWINIIEYTVTVRL